jgi:predicted membrane channel-forming protein YqfA (hemolysin III family)
MKESHKKQDFKYQLSGWILFILCAIFFLASSLKNQDTLAFIASVIFLIACIVFLIPLVRTIKNQKMIQIKKMVNIDEDQ